MAVEKIRVRSVEGHEIPFETYQAFQDPMLLTQAALERMIHGPVDPKIMRGVYLACPKAYRHRRRLTLTLFLSAWQ
uniref:hypothetical protein n=1 Tax=Kyrpidia spormannii TaxID=2055160 RepID=UPI001055A584|nr:hypothetical protein [Kyrpidia spormannii]